jgi:transposase
MAHYKHADTNQYRIVTLNFGELFPEDHFLNKLLELLKQFDLSKFDDGYVNDTQKGGRPAIPPDRMPAILIYSLLYGNISMRNLERDLHQRADLMFLAGGLTFDHSLVSVFRKRHAEAIKHLFSQTVFVGIEAGMIDLNNVCIDSTKIKASANRRDIGDEKQLKKRLEKIEEVCNKRYTQWQASSDEDEKQYLAKKLERYEHQKEKINKGIEFLKKNEDVKRIHLTDADADWHKDGSDHFIVAYSAQTAVDAKSKMIVHQEIVTGQSDSNYTTDMVKAVEQVKEEFLPEKTEPVKYILDCGYASEGNLEKLSDHDLYMPDREYARELGGKVKPEDRKDQNDQVLKFDYNSENDTFSCAAGGILTYRRIKIFHGKQYRTYRKHGCGNCAMQLSCAGKNTRKEIHIPEANYQLTKHKRMAHYGQSNKTRIGCVGGVLTQKMREKLSTTTGRKTYSLRFEVVEGVFGIIKYIRHGHEFLRRGVDRVQIECSERSIAHNVAKLLEFRRV